MITLPRVQNITESPELEIVKRYLESNFWEEAQDDLFAPELTVEFPHAPFGMLQYLSAYEYSVYRFWLRQTVKTHELVDSCIIPTTETDVFWTIRQIREDVNWAKRDGIFDCEFISKLTVKNGRIVNIKEYGNPVAYYRAINVMLPNFNYLFDCVKEYPGVRMEKGQKSHFTVEENMLRAFNNFANPINGHDDDPESIYAWNCVEVTPFAPMDMPIDWEGDVFDAQMEWMMRTVPEWNTIEEVPCYHTVDPNLIIVESYGHGRVTWSNGNGHYTQREIQVVHLDEEGKVDHFRVYFNSLNKYSSLNQMIPSFPYFNY